MRVVLIEDERAAMEQLEMHLGSFSEFDIEIVERIDSVADSIEFFSSSRSEDVDLIFMDIHLSDGYAFSIFKHVELSVPIIFTTAYDEYALKAFEVNCIDYVLKPISLSDIDRIFAKIKFITQHSRAFSPKSYVDTLLVVDGWRTTPLKMEDVAFFYRGESKVRAYDYTGKSSQVNLTLEKLEEQLDSDEFVRANRQFILARRSISDLESWEGNRAVVNLTIATPERIIISRTKVTQFKRWLSHQ